MIDGPDVIGARIAALEQHLLVAVLRRDDRARSLARGEIGRLKRQLAAAAQERSCRSTTRAGMAPAQASAH